jgi:hypothetical protein
VIAVEISHNELISAGANGITLRGKALAEGCERDEQEDNRD